MRSLVFRSLVLMIVPFTLAACGARGAPVATPEPTASSTPDVCSAENVKAAAGAVNVFMRQYDDESALASNVPRTELAPHIASLQAIRRQAQDQAVPACLTELKRLQLLHMNTVINTLLAFLGGGSQSGVTQGIEAARQEHDQYVLELARLMGVTPVVLERPPTQAATPGAASGPGVVAVNPGPAPVNLRAAPSADADLVTTLAVGTSVSALAASSDGQWYQVIVPGTPEQTAWVLATDVRLESATP